MTRRARVQSQTGYYHVMMRGNNREMIFSQIAEKLYFMELLQYQVDAGNISVVSYCLMNNHVHLLINSDLRVMSETLKWINIKFAGRYNYKYKRIGHVFQDRYKSEVINTKEQLLRVMRYIHNNPVKAKIVLKASDYQWSSYRSYTGKRNKLVSLSEIQMVMDLFSGSMEQFKKFHLEEENNEFLEIKEDLEQGREERARRIINKYCKQHQIIESDELNSRKDVLEKVIAELLEKSRLSHRRIAELIGVSRSTVHNIAKKL